jgi:hypothetical protein
MNGYRYAIRFTERVMKDGEVHATQNLYSTLSMSGYHARTLCNKVGYVVSVDGRVTCERCLLVAKEGAPK